MMCAVWQKDKESNGCDVVPTDSRHRRCGSPHVSGMIPECLSS